MNTSFEKTNIFGLLDIFRLCNCGKTISLKSFYKTYIHNSSLIFLIIFMENSILNIIYTCARSTIAIILCKYKKNLNGNSDSMGIFISK